MPHPPEHKLRWYQYSLRSLFILTTLVAIACSWYANEMFEAAERRKAIAEIIKFGGEVHYYDASDRYAAGEPPASYSWLRKLHGDEHLGNAVGVDLSLRPVVTDAKLLHLKGLTNLEKLDLHCTRITDAGLMHLRGLTKLDLLRLDTTEITDAGLMHLKDLTNVEHLWLQSTQVTDAGLVHLKGLTNLELLWLNYTQVTDTGLVHLKSLTKLKWLGLSNTQIADAGLVHLKSLTNLESLSLDHTQVTDEGVKKLQEALPNCEINHEPLP